MSNKQNAIHRSLFVGPKEHHYANFMSSDVKRRMLYNKDWALEKIILFEAIFQLSWSFGNPFFHSQANLQEATRLKRRVFEKHRDELLTEGLISITRSSKNGSYVWKINIEAVTTQISSIYDFKQIPPDERRSTRTNAIKFFQKRDNGNVFYQ